MKTELFQLKNGLKVLFVDTKTFSSVTTILLVGAGSRFENESNNGIAHFFEHMAFKGSAKYPTSLLISTEIDSLGGIHNAFTSKDHTGYYIKATNDHFPKVIDVLSDMVLNPLLQSEEIEKEKGVIIEELNMYEDMPQRQVGDIFEELLYKDNPLGFDIGGSKQTVSKFTKETFTEYIENLYLPENSVLIVAGGITNGNMKIEDYKTIIEEKFNGWKKGKVKEFEPMIENQTTSSIILKFKQTEQAHFCLGFRTFSLYDERKYAQQLLSIILGGGMSSKLFIEVREKLGLCYYISNSTEAYKDVGNMVTQAGIALQIDKVKKAIEVILREYKNITNGKITAEDFIKAKEMLKGRMILSLEDSTNIAMFYGKRVLFENKIVSLQDQINNLNKVKIEEIVQLAGEVFTNERLNFAMVGPFKEKTEFKDLLHI